MSWEQSPCAWHFIDTAFIRSSLLFIKVPFLDVICHVRSSEKKGVSDEWGGCIISWCCRFPKKWVVVSARCLVLPSHCWSWFRSRTKLYRLRPWYQPAELETGFYGAKRSLSSLPTSSIWLAREQPWTSPHQGQTSNSVCFCGGRFA